MLKTMIMGVLMVAFTTAFIVMWANSPQPKRLVGFGCTGIDGPVYMNEEDEVEHCDRIVPAESTVMETAS